MFKIYAAVLMATKTDGDDDITVRDEWTRYFTTQELATTKGLPWVTMSAWNDTVAETEYEPLTDAEKVKLISYQGDDEEYKAYQLTLAAALDAYEVLLTTLEPIDGKRHHQKYMPYIPFNVVEYWMHKVLFGYYIRGEIERHVAELTVEE